MEARPTDGAAIQVDAMSGLKPSVFRNVAADVVSLTNVIGPKLGKRFVPNPQVAKYAFVLKFSDGVVTGRSVARSLAKIQQPRGNTLIVGLDFTLEARQVAEAEACDLLSEREFGWTDARYAARRLRG
jgi:hypothetical protein